MRPHRGVSIGMILAMAALVTGAVPSARAQGALPSCADIPEVEAPPEWYNDAPIYVENEMPTDKVDRWAKRKPGYEGIWIDRNHHGWISVAFSEDAEARQAELAERFPGVGVVVVPVDWSMRELRRLQERIIEELGDELSFSSDVALTKGVVEIGVGVLTDERRAMFESRFAGEPLCIGGMDPTDAPPPGPQPTGGDGWRLLADQRDVGRVYWTAIATHQQDYRRMWKHIGLKADPPEVDFDAEVVIWFGAVYGTSCPGLRLDDVVVDRVRSVVHAEIALVDPPAACTTDARPHAYVVALQRDRLPAGPFVIQLDADGPPGGVPEERAIVGVDLSEPGSVARRQDIGRGQPQRETPREASANESGAVVEAEFPFSYRFDPSCGIEWLGQVNDVWWRTEVPSGSDAFIPPEWESTLDDAGRLTVTATLRSEPSPTIEAEANGHTVTYTPSADPAPECAERPDSV